MHEIECLESLGNSTMYILELELHDGLLSSIYWFCHTDFLNQFGMYNSHKFNTALYYIVKLGTLIDRCLKVLLGMHTPKKEEPDGFN